MGGSLAACPHRQVVKAHDESITSSNLTELSVGSRRRGKLDTIPYARSRGHSVSTTKWSDSTYEQDFDSWQPLKHPVDRPRRSSARVPLGSLVV